MTGLFIFILYSGHTGLIEQPIVCARPNFKPGYFDCRHLSETTLHATALDLPSEDYESKTYNSLVENLCCYPSHRCFIDTLTNWGFTEKWSHQDGRRKVLKQQKLDSFFSFRSVGFTQHLDSNIMQRCFKVWRVLRDIFFFFFSSQQQTELSRITNCYLLSSQPDINYKSSI